MASSWFHGFDRDVATHTRGADLGAAAIYRQRQRMLVGKSRLRSGSIKSLQHSPCVALRVDQARDTRPESQTDGRVGRLKAVGTAAHARKTPVDRAALTRHVCSFGKNGPPDHVAGSGLNMNVPSDPDKFNIPRNSADNAPAGDVRQTHGSSIGHDQIGPTGLLHYHVAGLSVDEQCAHLARNPD